MLLTFSAVSFGLPVELDFTSFCFGALTLANPLPSLLGFTEPAATGIGFDFDAFTFGRS